MPKDKTIYVIGHFASCTEVLRAQILALRDNNNVILVENEQELKQHILDNKPTFEIKNYLKDITIPVVINTPLLRHEKTWDRKNYQQRNKKYKSKKRR